jgi:hypothetical protein
MRGVNPKLWFYEFRESLAARPDHTARVLCGPAAERWLAAEMHGYLAAHLPSTLTCYGEDGTTDLTVYRTKSGGDGGLNGEWLEGRAASIEIKLLYRGHSEAAMTARTAELCRQVVQGTRHLAQVNVGYVFGVFTRWPGFSPRKRPDLASFRKACGRSIMTACENAKPPMRPAKQSVETIIEERTVAIGGVDVRFGLVGQHLLPN